METTNLFLEIRTDLYDYIDKEVMKRKLKGDRGASKVAFVEELVLTHKNSK